MNSGLQKDFNSILKPKLVEEGFRQIHLNGCIKYEELWRKGRLWFGCSFDWRDQYFETDLGHLYWFRDVMPRVVILGRYSAYVNFDPTKRIHEVGLIPILEDIRDSLVDSLRKYEVHYEDILCNHLQPKKGRYVKEYFEALGEEVKDDELQQYIS